MQQYYTKPKHGQFRLIIKNFQLMFQMSVLLIFLIIPEGYILTRHVTLRLLRLPAGRSFPVSAAVSSQAPMFKPRTETQHIAEQRANTGAPSVRENRLPCPKSNLYCDHCSIIMGERNASPTQNNEDLRRVHHCSRDVKPGQASWLRATPSRNWDPVTEIRPQKSDLQCLYPPQFDRSLAVFVCLKFQCIRTVSLLYSNLRMRHKTIKT